MVSIDTLRADHLRAYDSTHAGSASTAFGQVVDPAAIPVLDERALVALVIALAVVAILAMRR